ncbi:hypothetical protein A3D00_00205 [Candidatus Woesebacteria bacterium RIFCSPHIGHO2_02_FULL_38_9]|uniref:Uncharacterized protein n=1 Tax=Candidatus Woesebacteria bacterium RIFCSPHIGHO2_01_FULL_39_28 TaxID=1802496 RepID=A0A1F7YGG2_9BACT|nr:MAG: hypothetical protein A2627_05875 [Candidatus Woesebacteria bacterium RIFCSPHIGHO2_01_FULL_39_28]OGM33295.1 MAG: hypothetical protein A3D00_00205 [Candidatus Woesebacteria bacterium RIFCSPHIGHO2_02_FULL_38_9]OGM57442.1 MAG: hypothetical protein A3A50_05930 [Candidatus Woesebacteria bacterium RIFCSPLOWO2_01_FULL_38_20]
MVDGISETNIEVIKFSASAEKPREGELLERAIKLGGKPAEKAAKFINAAKLGVDRVSELYAELGRYVSVKTRVAIAGATVALLSSSGVAHAEGLNAGQADDLSRLAMEHPVAGLGAITVGLLSGGIALGTNRNIVKWTAGGFVAGAGLGFALEQYSPAIVQTLTQMSKVK